VKIKLVDKMGGLQDAIEYAAKKSGLKLPVETENLQKENPLSMLFGSLSQLDPEMLKKIPLQQLTETLLLNPILKTQ